MTGYFLKNRASKLCLDVSQTKTPKGKLLKEKKSIFKSDGRGRIGTGQIGHTLTHGLTDFLRIYQVRFLATECTIYQPNVSKSWHVDIILDFD